MSLGQYHYSHISRLHVYNILACYRNSTFPFSSHLQWFSSCYEVSPLKISCQSSKHVYAFCEYKSALAWTWTWASRKLAIITAPPLLLCFLFEEGEDEEVVQKYRVSLPHWLTSPSYSAFHGAYLPNNIGKFVFGGIYRSPEIPFQIRISFSSSNIKPDCKVSLSRNISITFIYAYSTTWNYLYFFVPCAVTNPLLITTHLCGLSDCSFVPRRCVRLFGLHPRWLMWVSFKRSGGCAVFSPIVSRHPVGPCAVFRVGGIRWWKNLTSQSIEGRMIPHFYQWRMSGKNMCKMKLGSMYFFWCHRGFLDIFLYICDFFGPKILVTSLFLLETNILNMVNFLHTGFFSKDLVTINEKIQIASIFLCASVFLYTRIFQILWMMLWHVKMNLSFIHF